MRRLLCAASTAMLVVTACSPSLAATPTPSTATPTVAQPTTAATASPATAAGPTASPAATVAASPSAVAAPKCTSSQLAARFVSGQGAAGTLFDTLELTNTSGPACTLNGFVSVQLLDAAGNPLPTATVSDGGQLGGRPGPAPFVLAPRAASQFVLAWSDVPRAGETQCPAAATVQVTPPGETMPLDVAGLTGIAPCDFGTVDVSPLRPPGATVP
jgi:hypothetical protein